MGEKYKKRPDRGTHSAKEQDKPLRHVKCIDCGLEWNVSRLANIPWYGYHCPVCTEKNRRNGYRSR